MSIQYGPWATSINPCGNPQLSAFWRQRLTKLVPTSQTSPTLSRRNLFWLGIAGALLLLPPTLCLAPAVADEAKPASLIYQVDPNKSPADWTAADMDRLLKVVDLRLNAGPEKLAKVRKLDDRQIEVVLLRPNDSDRRRVQRLLARPGTLEFRILANIHDNKALIERAQKDVSKNELLDDSGKRLAWWVPVKAAEAKNLAQDTRSGIALRTKKKDNREVTEVLVIPDDQNVTGDYLLRVEPAVDQSGKPTVRLSFNKTGGQLFGKLTSEHLPSETNEALRYKLGIILDGELFSAPTIQSTIYDKGEITGHFTEDEVADLANTLNAGSLPARLRPVENHPQQK
jgi:SecD/SecF fusion protein